MNRNRRILIVVFVVFTSIMLMLAIDMGQRTTAPWNKRRQLERALPTDLDDMALDTTMVDTVAVDSLK